MSDSQATPSPDTISADEFQSLLEKYSPLVESISSAKPAKTGQKTLVELDRYRYVEAPECFRLDNDKARRAMVHDDVKALVEWKLRHGKFRPTLMNLVTSNDASTVKTTVEDALKVYAKKSDAPAAVDILTKLKGIGPATASLLLSVHDPERVLFFSDEAFYWLCCGGDKKAAIKYNKKEFAALSAQGGKLMKRLGVRALDLEKAAYVAIKQPVGESGSGSKSADKAKKETVKDEKVPAPKRAKGQAKKESAGEGEPALSAKRKQSSDDDKEPAAASVALRRSKRNRPA